MNTAFLLLAQYEGRTIIPLDILCRDFFQHMQPDYFVRQVTNGKIALPLIQIDPVSSKSARGVHLLDLAAWIDKRRAAAQKECDQLQGRR